MTDDREPGGPITREALKRKLQAHDRSTEENRIARAGLPGELERWAYEHGYEITDMVYENGVPGTTPILLRDDFVNAIRHTRDNPEYAGIIVPSTARLARDQAAFDAVRHAMSAIGKHLFVGILDQSGRLIGVHDAAGDETPEQRYERQQRELEAIQARRAYSMEGNRARRAKIKNMGWGGGYLKPCWFQDLVPFTDLDGKERKEAEVNHARLQWALWIHDRRLERWSWRTIANELNRLAVLTSTGKPWDIDAVRRSEEQLAKVPAQKLAIWLAGLGPGCGPDHAPAVSVGGVAA